MIFYLCKIYQCYYLETFLSKICWIVLILKHAIKMSSLSSSIFKFKLSPIELYKRIVLDEIIMILKKIIKIKSYNILKIIIKNHNPKLKKFLPNFICNNMIEDIREHVPKQIRKII